MRIAKAAVAAPGDRRALADFGEIGNERLAVLLVDLCADRHFQHHVLAVGARAILAHPIAAALGLEVLLIAIIDQGIEPVDRLDHDVTAVTAVAAIRSPELDEFLTPERD